MTKVREDGFTEDFKIHTDGLRTWSGTRSYKPEEVNIVNFYRFEGPSDPADNVILYVIETTDGKKGTLTDAYGAYADQKISKFMDEVEEIAKKKPSGTHNV
jgi:hypothetical protein